MKKPEGLDWLLVLGSCLPSFRTEANTYQAPAKPLSAEQISEKETESQGTLRGFRYFSLGMKKVPDLQSLLPGPDDDIRAQRDCSIPPVGISRSVSELSKSWTDEHSTTTKDRRRNLSER